MGPVGFQDGVVAEPKVAYVVVVRRHQLGLLVSPLPVRVEDQVGGMSRASGLLVAGIVHAQEPVLLVADVVRQLLYPPIRPPHPPAGPDMP